MESLSGQQSVESDRWELAFVLPNLRLPDPPSLNTLPIADRFEIGDVALVPPSDPRIVVIRENSRAATKLLSGFVDTFNRTVEPSVLIYRVGAPATINGEAIVAFRNAIALSVILPSWLTSGSSDKLYSDAFDFYPTSISRNDRLVTTTVALSALFSEDAPFRAMPSPYISRCSVAGADYYLRRALDVAWVERFQLGLDDHFHRALFRSLELAYLALATPWKNQASMYEWGATIGLWVSALEVLGHPAARGRAGGVDRLQSLELLQQYRWNSESLKKAAWVITYGGGARKKTQNVNAIQWAAWKLYDARNAFMHGNPVNDQTIRPFGVGTSTLIEVAPAIYRTALIAHLEQRTASYRGLTDEAEEWSPAHPHHHHVVRMIGEDFSAEQAVRRMLGLVTEPKDSGHPSSS